MMESAELLSRYTFERVTPEQLPVVLAIREHTYVREKGRALKVIQEDAFDQTAINFLASTTEGEPAAAIRFNPHRPFELESYINIEAYIPSGRRPAEINRFCVLPQFRRISRSGFVHLGLLKIVYDYATSLGVTDLFICTNPQLQRLYESALFEPLTGPTIRYEIWEGDLQMLMKLDLLSLKLRCKNSKSSYHRLLYELLCTTKISTIIAPAL